MRLFEKEYRPQPKGLYVGVPVPLAALALVFVVYGNFLGGSAFAWLVGLVAVALSYLMVSAIELRKPSFLF